MDLYPSRSVQGFSVALLLLYLFSPLTSAQQEDFTKLIVFGDSLSDTGNLAIIDLPSPYFSNRISDGPVAVDFIATSIGSNANSSRHFLGSPVGFNYAVAGGNIVGDDREDLASQIDVHLNRINDQTDPNALYVVFAGGNDLRDIRSIGTASIAAQRINAAVAQLDAQIQRLVDAGARAFFVPNVPNIARIPETLERIPSDQTVSSRAQTYVQQYNNALAQTLQKYQSRSDLAFTTFDLYAAFENILDNFSSFGFRNREEGCFNPSDFPFSVSNPPIELECIIFGFESRVFFDNIHPSSRTNELLGAQMVAALPSLGTIDSRNRRSTIPAILDLLFDD